VLPWCWYICVGDERGIRWGAHKESWAPMQLIGGRKQFHRPAPPSLVSAPGSGGAAGCFSTTPITSEQNLPRL
jgi:hypothetical protein